ncbi:MAG: uroporphyrinogen-III C-methyltransferase [Deltaproteobacteria bacterium]|jgi:uroporphyrinogen III methyltransferase/synthase|nr:uroporphyrinogen-III C-methyltransferase [Deltaproteobacteria bacterium]
MGGIVYLVGAGPGDPGLLTLKGERLLREADVVVYDYLAAPGLLSLARPSAKIIYVGKSASDHAMPQEGINRLLVDEAKAGNKVVRLKGGDPYIFGRGGEEALELWKEGIPFEVVPGISSTVAAAAYAGIPLTHRGFSSQVALITGHEDPTKKGSAHDWAALARMGTLVSVMGAANLASISEKLIAHGKDPGTPAAMIQWGATPRQRVAQGTLAALPGKAKELGIGAPALLVVGPVVGLRDRLDWFGKKPLLGKRILVTRSRDQASRLSEALAGLGAFAVERPLIRIVPVAPNPGLAERLKRLSDYKYLVLTSPNGARILMEALFAEGLDSRALFGLRIAAIGPGTAGALAAYGLRADIVPKSFVAEGILEAMKGGPKGPALIARAREARDVLPAGLKEMGFEPDLVALYDTLPVGPMDIDSELLREPPDACCLASASTARGLAEIVPEERRGDFPCVSIGPITTAEARRLGLKVATEAQESTIPGLVKATLGFLGAKGLQGMP